MRGRRASGVPLALLLCLVTGCGGVSDGPSLRERVKSSRDPVAFLTTSAQHSAGVREHPLSAGQTLAFVWKEPTAPIWTMAGVGYPLRVYGVADDGNVGAAIDMKPCLKGTVQSCPSYQAGYMARIWLEERPGEPDPAKPSPTTD